MTTYNVTPHDATALLHAVNQANTDGDDSTVNVPAGTYNMSPSDEIFIDGDGTFTLTGAGARSTIIDGGGAPIIPGEVTTNDSLFYIAAFCKCPGPAHATISGITVQNANPDEDGGAFYVENAGPADMASLHLFDSTVTNNQSEDDGGGIYNEGTLNVERVTFSNNLAEADGSAIATKSINEIDSASRGTPPNQNFATTTIVNSTFTGNISDSDTGCEGGGAIEQERGNTTIVNSTIVGNTSYDGTCEHVQPTGGGIDIEAGPASIVNSIVTGNTASPGEEELAAQPRPVRGALGPACDVGAFEVPVALAVVPPVNPAKPAAPKVGVAGVRRACVSSSFHVRFHIATSASVKSVVVKLDGKKIKSTSQSSFTLSINSKKLSAGRHR